MAAVEYLYQTGLALRVRADLPNFLEHDLAILRRNADAGVCDAHMDETVHGSCCNRDPSVFGSEFHRIRQQVQHHLFELALVGTDLLFNNAGISTRNILIDALTYEQWSNVVAVNLTDSFLCAQHAFRMMKNKTRDARRADHQQRLGIGAYAATELHTLCGDQARGDRGDTLAVAGRARIRHCVRPDRYWQRGDDAQ